MTFFPLIIAPNVKKLFKNLEIKADLWYYIAYSVFMTFFLKIRLKEEVMKLNNVRGFDSIESYVKFKLNEYSGEKKDLESLFNYMFD